MVNCNGLKACIKSNKDVEYLSAKKGVNLLYIFENGDWTFNLYSGASLW